MAKYQKKLPPPDLKAAQSWERKFIRDTLLDKLGLVHAVVQTTDGIRLQVRFQGETESRLVALEPVASMEYILPGDVKAHYRPLNEQDRAVLASAAGRAA